MRELKSPPRKGEGDVVQFRVSELRKRSVPPVVVVARLIHSFVVGVGIVRLDVCVLSEYRLDRDARPIDASSAVIVDVYM